MEHLAQASAILLDGEMSRLQLQLVAEKAVLLDDWWSVDLAACLPGRRDRKGREPGQ